MKIELSDTFIANLKERGVEVTSPVEIDDDRYAEGWQQLRSHPVHANESDEQLRETLIRGFLWADKGVPEHTGDPEVGSGVMAARRSVSILDELRKQNKEVLPSVQLGFESIIRHASSVASDDRKNIEKAINASSTNIVSKLHASRTEAAGQHEEITTLQVGIIVALQDEGSKLRKAIYGVGGAIVLLLAALVFFTGKAHGQVGLDGLQVKANGTQSKLWMGGTARLNFGTGLAVSCSGSPIVCTITATGVGPGGGITSLNGETSATQTFTNGTNIAVTTNLGTHAHTIGISGTIGLSNGGTNYASNTGAAGKVLIGNGSGQFVEGDPLVQGLVAAGASVAAVNPVYVGGVDGSGNSKGLVLDSSGRPTVNVNGTLQVQSNSANIATETTLSGIKTGTDKLVTQKTADFDTGAGTDTVPAMGIAVPASGGAAIVPGDATNGLKVQVTTMPSTTVTGPLTDTQLRASAVPVTATNATAANLKAEVVFPSAQSVNATLAAETTKVIGTTRNADGAGNLYTTNSTTYTAKFAQDGNLLGTLGTAFTTAGKVDVKGADGDVFVRQATAANLNATVVGSLADNGAAAATNRVGTLPAVTQTSYENGTASTQGRNAALSTGSDGLLWVANLPAIRPASYTASAAFAGSSTTDIARLPGNASNTVLVTEIKFSCTQTTAGSVTVTVNKRSTAGSGGTAASMTVVPDDSNYAAGVSAPQSYTGTGPTVGTLVGAIDNMKVGCLATSTAAPQDIYILNLRQKPIVLRGTAENVAINLGGAVTGGNVTVTFRWIETATITP